MKLRGITWLKPVAVGAAGLLAGVVLATTVSAVADEAPSDDPASSESADPSRPQRSDEELLTGETADNVRQAALEEYPGATVVRIETDSDGVYEAHLTTADGLPVTVELNADFEVTGEEEGHFGHGHDGFGGPGSDEGPEDIPDADSGGQQS